MVISYHESHLGHPGHGWDAESLKEVSEYLLQDRKALFIQIQDHLASLKKGGIQEIYYTVKITVSK